MKRVFLAVMVGCGLVAGGAMAADGPTSLTRVKLSELPKDPVVPVAVVAPAASVKISAKEAAAEIKVEKQEEGSSRIVAEGACVARQNDVSFSDQLMTSSDEGVMVVRVERLIEKDGNATLVRHRILFDARSRGSRVEGTDTVPLRRVATSNDERIYAYQDDANVHLVWATTQSVRLRDFRSITFSPPRCGHAHLMLDAKEPNGLTANGVAVATLASTDKGKPKNREFRLTASLTKSSRDPDTLLSVGLSIQDANRSAAQGLNVVNGLGFE